MTRSLFRPRTVRARITALATLTVALALTAGAFALVVTLERSLTRSGDDLSRSRVQTLAALAEAGRLPRRLGNIGDDSVAQVVTDAGVVVAASPNISGHPAIATLRPGGPDPVVAVMRGIPDDDETEDYRVWVARRSSAAGPVTIYVGSSLESVADTVETLTRSLVFGIPALVALLASATWIMVARTLRPVETIRAEVAAVSHRELDRRVPVPEYDDEVGRLAVTMNQMLERLEDASRRQREFVANASHELQSPLASFRAQLEVALAHPERADWTSTAQDLRSDGDAMEGLVRDLLFLAREDDSSRPVPDDLVDLDDVVLEEASRLRTTCQPDLDTTSVTAAPVRGSRADLVRLVRNLLENAAHHATSLILVELSAADQVRLAVTDDGVGIAPSHRERIFERFYRADGSRDRASGGTGLGLAITRTIAERHGGSVDLDPCESGARFVVLLPNP